MNVVFVVEYFPRLSETFVLNQITGLIDRGVKVDIIAKYTESIDQVHPDIAKYKLLDRTKYLDEIDRKIPQNKARRICDAVRLFKSHIHKRPLSIIKSLNILKLRKDALSLQTFYLAIGLLHNNPYDVIHCHFGPNGKIGLRLKEIGALEGKLVTAFHGYDVTMYVEQKGKNIYDHLFKKVDLIMPISSLWQKKLVNLGCDKNKIIVHRMGIDTKLYRPKQKYRKGGSVLKLLSVARFVEKKGLEYAIAAVAEVAQKHKSIMYNIVGDGELSAKYQNLISQIGANKYIRLLGYKNAEEVRSIMQNTDIFLAPSVTSKKGDQEGIPVVIMEAMAMEMPVISTYHSGIPELVADGKSGYLVEERNEEQIKNKILFFIDNPGEIDKMGKEGRKIVEANYEIDILNDKLLELYKKLNTLDI